jgi:diguanylate cyclase (GGDEF)-like protein
VTPRPVRRVPDPVEDGLQEVLWRLLGTAHRDGADALARLLDDAAAAFTGRPEPLWTAWQHAVAARQRLMDDDAAAVHPEVTAAREALETCPPSADTALVMAYLAHVEVTADHAEGAMLLAVDASLLTESPAMGGPSRALQEAHRWLSLALSGLDLEELALGHAVRGQHVAAALRDPERLWRMRLLAARQNVELAQTELRRGDAARAAERAVEAIASATSARDIPYEPDPSDDDLLDVVHAWALVCSGDLDDALRPLRRVRRHVQGYGGVWLRGYTDLVLARLLARLAERDGHGERGEESIGLLVDAAGAFAAAGDRRRYRQCLLELGRNTAALGRPAEALHWLEAYRGDTGRANARSRDLWAEMFVRRSRLREAERTAAMLRRHALEDPLTGLGNRRSAERRLGALRLGEEPVSLAVVDVDRFKSVNDAASHSQGDAVLRRVADLLREHSRTGDEVYRWAGDEFLVVLPTATEAQAVVVMERLRTAVAEADWSDLDLSEPITVSIGVATAPAVDDPEAPVTIGWRTLFDTADLLLFSAKRGGRNRVRAPGAQSGENAADGTASSGEEGA